MDNVAPPGSWVDETHARRYRRGGPVRWRHFLVGVGAALGSVWSSAGVAAPSEPLRVDFTGPRECGAPDRLLELTRGLLGVDADHAGVEVTAVVSVANERRYTLRLALQGAVQGRRTIAGANCDEALRAGAVVIALSINPNALSTPEGPEPPPSAAPKPAAESERAPEPAPEAAPQRLEQEPARPQPRPAPPRENSPELDAPARPDRDSDSETVLLGLSARAHYGLSPDPRLGVRATVGVVWTNLLLRAQGYFDPANEHDSAAVGAVRFTSLGGGGDVCARSAEWASLSFAVCGGWLVTRVTASAPEVAAAATRDALVSAASVGLGVGVRMSERWSLLAEGGVTLPTARPRFTVDVEGAGPTVVYQIKPGALATLGLQWGI